MKATPFSPGFAALVACATLLLAARGPGAQEPPAPPAPSAQGGLHRVDPGQPSDDPNDLKGLLAREFERDRWRERLLQPDLEQREKSFDALLKRTRFDPVARAFLEELAADPKGGELAWTARLGLRELGRASVPLQGFAPGADPFGSAQRMQQWMDELFGRDGLTLRLPHAGLPQAPPAVTHGSGRSVQVEQTERGAEVRITETIDGQEQTREFQGKSLQEILDAHPELQGELDGLSIRVQPGSPLDLRFDLGERLGKQRRFPGERQEGLRLAPQGKSRPILTDRLGVIVQPVSAERARELGLQGKGLLVERAVPETYAHLLGVGAGDVLIELNRVVLSTAADIERAMSERRPDDELTLVWLDQLGQRQEKTWKPGER
jgi:hypothetical protein